MLADQRDSAPVAVTVKANSEVERFSRDERLQTGQTGFLDRFGMVIREMSIIFGEKGDMFTGQSSENATRSACLHATPPVARRSDRAETAGTAVEKATAVKDHVEAVIIGAIMAAAYLCPALLLIERGLSAI